LLLHVHRQMSRAFFRKLKDMHKGLETWQSESAYIKALHGFASEYEKVVDSISQQFDSQSLENVKATIHKLKGISGNLKLWTVYSVLKNIDAALREGLVNNARDDLPYLSTVISEAIESIKCLEIKQTHEKPLENNADTTDLPKIFSEMINGLDQFNPYVLQPIISKLEFYLTNEQLNPIIQCIDKFEFNQAKAKMIDLSKKMGIVLEEHYE
ncbi:MAG: Hpt domain-containing protein, partial [Desulfamplus sp.]|nr:Hpt domain-containing protein [Desulfamplus sp.]